MRDLFSSHNSIRNNIISTATKMSEKYGHWQISLPMIEQIEVFNRTLGLDSDIISKEMFEIASREGGGGGEKGGEREKKRLALRPEGTAGVIRALVSAGINSTYPPPTPPKNNNNNNNNDNNNNNINNNNNKFPHHYSNNHPTRVFYFGSMFRYERPQRGRFREFSQFGIEVVNSSHPREDVTAIEMGAELLKELGLLDRTRLLINSVGDAESRANYRGKLAVFLEKYRSDLSKDSLERVQRGSFLRVLDSKDPGDRKIIQDAPKLRDSLSAASAQRFVRVLNGLTARGIAFEEDPLLVRGLDYYSHTAFEFISHEINAQSAILAGGRYDLGGTFGGRSLPSVGWALGVDRVMTLKLAQKMAGEGKSRGNLVEEEEGGGGLERGVGEVLVVALQEESDEQDWTKEENAAADLASILRAGGIATEILSFNSAKKALKAANSGNYKACVIAGSNEVESALFGLKNLKTTEQVQVSKDQILAAVQKILA